MLCLECGNCRKGEALFYCTGRNEFITGEAADTVIVREKTGNRWRKGDPLYEQHRRQQRQDKVTI